MKKFLLFFAFIIVNTGYASAQQKIFIKVDGIDGESTDANHSKWIEGKAFSGGAVVKTSSSPSATAPFKFTVCVDKSTVRLLERLHQKTKTQKVEIEFVRVGSSPFVYYKLLLENVSVVELNDGGTTDDDRLLVNVSFDPDRYKSTYIEQGPNGSPIGQVTFGWNTVTNTSY